MKLFSKRNIIILVIILVLGAGTFWYFKSKKSGEDVPTEEVRRGTVIETVSVTGELLHQEYADLSFLAVGEVKKILVEEGQAVKAGDSLVVLDSPVLQAQLNEARIALSIAEENEKFARRNWDSLKSEEREAKKLTTEAARADIRTIQAQIRNNTLLSPVDGFVSKLDTRIGETVTAGQMIARVSQDSGLEIKARVPESDIAKLERGMKAEVTFDSLSDDEIFEAEIIEIDPSSTVVQDVVSYNVTFSLPSTDPRLKEGMTANIDIEAAKRENVLVVPFRALTQEDEKMYAELRGADGKFSRVEVMTGLEGDEGEVEVKSGLSEGDHVTLGTKQKK